VKAIVGLGNPGPRYRDTRHNMGFAVVDRLARRVVLKDEHYRDYALIAEAQTRGSEAHRLWLVKPLTYMNRSGHALRGLVERQHLSLDKLLVVYDDLDLPLGRIRLKARGGSGGHRGMESIIRALGTDEFPRLRCGIGRPASPEEDVVDYVLMPFAPGERDKADSMIADAVEAALRFVAEGIDAAMNEFNTRNGAEGR